MTTFVLVHGAWHTGHCWSRVVPLLGAAGHRVLTPTLTGYGETTHLMGPDVGVSTHVDDVVSLLVAEDLEDVVLVGHSISGLVISGVANEVPQRLARLVFLDAMEPQDGQNAVDVMPMTQTMVDRALASDSGWRVPPLPELPAPFGLFGVTSPADVTWVRTMLSDQSMRSLLEPVRLDNPAARDIPRLHVVCTVRPDGFTERPLPERQPNGEPTQVRALATGHDAMITEPVALSRVLLAAD